jgi:PPIC-type PPIASE domain
MKIHLLILPFLLSTMALQAQKSSLDKVKAEMEASTNPVDYVKTKLKKKYAIDTIFITSNRQFLGRPDSLAYHGQVRKVYGPWPGDSVLVQIVGKAPNIFYHASQILLDTSKMRKEVAQHLADTIIARVKRKEKGFGDMARVYTMDGSGATQGDLGWRARGTLIPQLEGPILKHKKGEVFKTWTSYGLHIIRIEEDPKQDTGFVLLLRVIL